MSRSFSNTVFFLCASLRVLNCLFVLSYAWLNIFLYLLNVFMLEAEVLVTFEYFAVCIVGFCADFPMNGMTFSCWIYG